MGTSVESIYGGTDGRMGGKGDGHTMTEEQSHRIARRAVLRGVAGSALAAVLAACGTTSPASTPLPNRDSFARTQVAVSAGFAVSTTEATPIRATAPVDLSGHLQTVCGIRFAFLPSADPQRALSDNAEILAYLRVSLGATMLGLVSSNYATVIDALNKGTVDIAYFSPLAYIYAKGPATLVPLIQGESPDGKIATSRSFLIVSAASTLNSPADLRGKTVAFTDQNSLGGYLVPAYSIAKNAGLKVNADYTADFRGTAPAVYAAVMSGAAAAGAIPFNDFDDGVAKGQINKDALHVIDTSFDYPGSVVAARNSLDPRDRDVIQSVFLALSNQPQDAKVLSQFVLSPPRGAGDFGGNTVKVRKADDNVYNNLRDIPRTLGIALESIIK